MCPPGSTGGVTRVSCAAHTAPRQPKLNRSHKSRYMNLIFSVKTGICVYRPGSVRFAQATPHVQQTSAPGTRLSYILCISRFGGTVEPAVRYARCSSPGGPSLSHDWGPRACRPGRARARSGARAPRRHNAKPAFSSKFAGNTCWMRGDSLLSTGSLRRRVNQTIATLHACITRVRALRTAPQAWQEAQLLSALKAGMHASALAAAEQGERTAREGWSTPALGHVQVAQSRASSSTITRCQHPPPTAHMQCACWTLATWSLRKPAVCSI